MKWVLSTETVTSKKTNKKSPHCDGQSINYFVQVHFLLLGWKFFQFIGISTPSLPCPARHQSAAAGLVSPPQRTHAVGAPCTCTPSTERWWRQPSPPACRNKKQHITINNVLCTNTQSPQDAIYCSPPITPPLSYKTEPQSTRSCNHQLGITGKTTSDSGEEKRRNRKVLKTNLNPSCICKAKQDEWKSAHYLRGW